MHQRSVAVPGRLLLLFAFIGAASLAVVLAPSVESLIVARFVQALAAAAGIVIARAMVADLARGYDGLRALGLRMS